MVDPTELRIMGLKPNCYGDLSPPQALNRLLLVFAVLYRSGAPEETRTPNPQIRSLVLYPIELRAHSRAGV